jgi:hypothetical protein
MHLKRIHDRKVAASSAVANLCSQLASGYGMAATGSCSPNVGAKKIKDGTSGFLGSGLSKGVFAQKVLAHATAGGTLSVLQGGKFGHGFVSAGITEAISPVIDNLHSSFAKVAASAMVGGTVSEIAGGKFGNGAVTGAFQMAMLIAAESMHGVESDSDVVACADGDCEAETLIQDPLEHLTPFKMRVSRGKSSYDLEVAAYTAGGLDQVASCVEQERFDLEAVAATLVSTLAVGTMYKTPAELRGLGITKGDMNKITNQLSRWSGRLNRLTGTKAFAVLRRMGRNPAMVRISGAATGLMYFEGMYDWGVLARCGVICSTSNCGY